MTLENAFGLLHHTWAVINDLDETLELFQVICLDVEINIPYAVHIKEVADLKGFKVSRSDLLGLSRCPDCPETRRQLNNYCALN